MFQKLLCTLQILYFAENIFRTKEMIFEQYLVLGIFIILVNCRAFNYKFALVRPLRGMFLMILIFFIGLGYLFVRRRFIFLNAPKSDFIWIMHSFMFYSIFYLILFVIVLLIGIIFFFLLSMSK